LVIWQKEIKHLFCPIFASKSLNILIILLQTSFAGDAFFGSKYTCKQRLGANDCMKTPCTLTANLIVFNGEKIHQHATYQHATYQRATYQRATSPRSEGGGGFWFSTNARPLRGLFQPTIRIQ